MLLRVSCVLLLASRDFVCYRTRLTLFHYFFQTFYCQFKLLYFSFKVILFLVSGVCERYRVEHEQCAPLEKANGHCGCGPGFTCKFVPAELATLPTAQLVTLPELLQVSKRRSIYMPGPGTIQCEKV